MKVLLLCSALIGFALCEQTQVKKQVGDSVTLHIRTYRYVRTYLWTFMQQHDVSPSIIVKHGEVTDVGRARFGTRLDLCVDSGSISISGLILRDSGTFQAWFKAGARVGNQTYILAVSEVSPPKPVFAWEGARVTLNTNEELRKDYNVSWLQGEACDGKILAQRKSNVTFIREGWRGEVQLSLHSGSLTLISASARFSGFYCVKLRQSGGPLITKRYRLIVSFSEDISHLNYPELMEVIILVAAVVSLTLLIYYCKKKYTQRRHDFRTRQRETQDETQQGASKAKNQPEERRGLLANCRQTRYHSVNE